MMSLILPSDWLQRKKSRSSSRRHVLQKWRNKEKTATGNSLKIAGGEISPKGSLYIGKKGVPDFFTLLFFEIPTCLPAFSSRICLLILSISHQPSGNNEGEKGENTRLSLFGQMANHGDRNFEDISRKLTIGSVS